MPYLKPFANPGVAVDVDTRTFVGCPKATVVAAVAVASLKNSAHVGNDAISVLLPSVVKRMVVGKPRPDVSAACSVELQSPASASTLDVEIDHDRPSAEVKHFVGIAAAVSSAAAAAADDGDVADVPTVVDDVALFRVPAVTDAVECSVVVEMMMTRKKASSPC